MKKNYIQPNINIVKIVSQHLMAGSEQFGAKGEANSSSTSIFSREDSGWDDDDE